jgi:hypothetical protein
MLQDDLTARTRRNRALPSIIQLLVALSVRFFACGAFYNAIGDTFGLHKSTLCRAVHKVASAIMKRVKFFVAFPEPDTVMKPAENALDYLNRKGYFSINVQAVVDSTCEFTNIVVKWPGSSHDFFIFSQSALCTKLESGALKGILLGDSGYPCRTYLLTPYIAENDDHREAAVQRV